MTIIINGIIFSIYIEGLSDEMLIYSSEISYLLDEENFDLALKKTNELSDFIEEKKVMLASTTDHNKLDEIEKTLAELASYIESRKKHDSLAKCEVLDFLFEHFPRDYMLKAENIL